MKLPIPSLFVPCDKCRTPGYCKVYGQCERLRKKAAIPKERKQKK